MRDDIMLIDLSRPIPATLNGQCCVGAFGTLNAKGIIDLVVGGPLRHILQHSTTHYERETAIASDLLHKPEPDLQNLARLILGSSDIGQNLSLPFWNSKTRDETLNQVLDFVKKIPGSELLWDSIKLVANELFTNAIYNAPTDSTGRFLYCDLPRTIAVQLDPGRSPNFFSTFNNQYLLLACQDPYGSLLEQKFFARFQRAYFQEDLAQPNMGPGGAGLGCRMLLDRSCELYVICKPRKSSIFCCVLPLNKSAREAGKILKNVHFVFYEE